MSSFDDNPWGASPVQAPQPTPPVNDDDDDSSPPTLQLDKAVDEAPTFSWGETPPGAPTPPSGANGHHEPEVQTNGEEQQGNSEEQEESERAREEKQETEKTTKKEEHNAENKMETVEEVKESTLTDEEVTEVHGVQVVPPSTFPPPVSIPAEGPPMDDFGDESSFGPTPTSAQPATDSFGDAFDDDDEFGEPGGGDDDFGDFDEGDDSAFGAAPPMTAFDAPPPPPPPASVPVLSTSAPAFRLDLSAPNRTALGPQLAPFLSNLYPSASSSVSDEPERQVEGVGQVLVSESARSLLTTFSSLPPLRPLDWRRSKIRREHLIALGVPVNLDDSSDSKPLGSLVLPSQEPHRPASPGPSSAPARSSSPLPFTAPSPYSSRPSTPSEDRRKAANVPPPLDKKRALEVCDIPREDLLLMKLDQLQKLKEEIESISRDASGALTHALLMREKEAGDGETYHGMIQDLVSAAAKMKTSGTRSGAGSPLARSSSGTGRWGRKSSGGTTGVR
ncbi:hypothetical protein T439DRAFT_326615 [Meredithblackwellia eburnea MCA 4105]